jgi:hypothetical protein
MFEGCTKASKGVSSLGVQAGGGAKRPTKKQDIEFLIVLTGEPVYVIFPCKLSLVVR